MRGIKLAWCIVVGTLLQGCVSESTIVEERRLVERAPDQKQVARTRLALGVSYLERGDTAQAKFNLEKALQTDDSLPEVHNALAYYYQIVGEDDQAEAAYEQSLRRDSDNADTRNNFGAFLCQRGKYEEAEQQLLHATKIAGYIRVADSYENLALCARSQQKFDLYQQYLQQGLRHNGNKVTLLYHMAVLHYAKNELPAAQRYQQKLQQLGQVSPQVTLLRYLIAKELNSSSELAAAEKMLLSAYAAEPEANWLLSGDFSAAEPVQLRQQVAASKPVSDNQVATANPQIKVVRRKSGLQPDTQAYGLSVDNQPLQTTATDSASPAKPARYQVQHGETLFQIASRFRMPATELQRFNQLTSPSDIRPGQWLKLSAPAVLPEHYRVEAGDTLFSIAFKFNLPVEQLATLNQLAANAELSNGQLIRLRAGGESQ